MVVGVKAMANLIWDYLENANIERPTSNVQH
jgi:hypothetical protein